MSPVLTGVDFYTRLKNAADRDKLLRKQKADMGSQRAKDKAFLETTGGSFPDTSYTGAGGDFADTAYAGTGGDFADTAYAGTGGDFADTAYAGAGGDFATADKEFKVPPEDLNWFKKETGTAFNPNSVADVYYLMNRKYNKVSESKATELEGKRTKGSAKANAARVSTMKSLMQ